LNQEGHKGHEGTLKTRNARNQEQTQKKRRERLNHCGLDAGLALFLALRSYSDVSLCPSCP
jgi:hypothetical protein